MRPPVTSALPRSSSSLSRGPVSHRRKDGNHGDADGDDEAFQKLVLNQWAPFRPRFLSSETPGWKRRLPIDLWEDLRAAGRRTYGEILDVFKVPVVTLQSGVTFKRSSAQPVQGGIKKDGTSLRLLLRLTHFSFIVLLLSIFRHFLCLWDVKALKINPLMSSKYLSLSMNELWSTLQKRGRSGMKFNPLN